MLRLLPPFAALVVAASALAQGYQCSLLGTQNLHPPYNGIWGYVAPNGKEYALLGSELGVAIIDCTVPNAPVERAWFPGVNNPWRELRTYGHYVYVTSEGMSGFQVIDMANPDAPVNLGIVGSAQFGNAHNLCVDMGTGRLYILGCNTGTPVYDAAANPASPPFLGYALGSGNSNYFHDLSAENGFGYGSMIYTGIFRIWDLSTFPPTVLSDSLTPSAFTHNAWPNATGTITVTTDERDGSVVRFYDTTNKLAPVARGQISVNQDSVPHNSYIRGNIAHTSWYTEGYQAIDFSDPTTPIVVASYDTYPGASGGYSGAWGCFPFLPSGNVYISDRSTGLYVLRPHLTDLAIAHAPLANTTNEDGPYTVTATITSSHSIGSVVLRYRIDGGALQGATMLPSGPSQWSAAIPGQNAASTIEYWIEATDTQAQRRSPRIGEHRFLVGTRVSRWLDDFESGSPGWTTGGTGNDWQLGASAGRAGSSLSLGWQDPVLAASGTNVRGTDLGIATGNGAYANNANSFLQSPAIATNGVQGLRLRFRRWLSLVGGDTARLRVNGTLVWSANVGTYDTRWTWADFDVASILDAQPTATIRFELQTTTSNAAGGWNLDDVELYTLHDAVPANSYGAGTPGTGAVVPVIALASPPVLGTNVQFAGSAMLPNSVAVLALNLQPASFPALGVQVLVEPLNAVLLTGLISGGGTTSWSLALPATPVLDNVYVYAQAFPLDPGSPGGFLAASAGLRFRSALSAP